MTRTLLCCGCAREITVDTSDWVTDALAHVLADRNHPAELRLLNTHARFDAITRPLRRLRRYRWPS